MSAQALSAALDGTDPVAGWFVANVLLVVVAIVAWVLLRQVIAAARAIKGEVAQVWANGQRVANNTIHIASLYKTQDAVGAIIEKAGGIATHAKAIEAHAKECAGCPACLLKK